MKINVFIPTYKRVNRQITWPRLPKEVQAKTVLVVNKEEAEYHKAQGRPILVSPKQGLGMAAIRGWILDYAFKQGMKYIAILDDDLYFQKRRPDGRITKMSEAELLEAFIWMEQQLDAGYAHCALGMRFLGYAAKGDHVECSRAMQALAYNLEKVKIAKAHFRKDVPDWFPMDDFHMTLQLLEAGYPNRVSLIWRASPAPPNAPGGCSEQRSLERQNASAQLLQRLHPNTVTVRSKKPWAGMEGEMFDVAVKWKKALWRGDE